MRVVVCPVVAFCFCVLVACKAREASPSGGRAVPRDAGAAQGADARPVHGVAGRVAGARVAAGPLIAPVIYADHALILPAGADVAAARKTAERVLASRQLAIAAPAPDHPPTTLIAQVVTPTLAEIGFASVSLDYFGRGLGDADRAGLAAATGTVVISIAGPPDRVAEIHHAGAEVSSEVARATGAWVLDQWTNETFTRVAFEQARPTGFPLDTHRLIVVHMVRDQGSAVFLETRGLNRLGMPDLFLRSVPQSFADEMLELINAAAQTLVEQGGLRRDGVLDVNFSALTTAGWAERAAEITAAGGSGRITFEAIWSVGDHDEPGADPGLIELLLPGDGDVAARAYAALRTLVADPEDGAGFAKNSDAELLAARDRARKALAALAPRYADGAPELENLQVKAPFKTSDGEIEWMWVEVQTWKAGVLTGTLLNEPFEPSAVRAGDRVEVDADEIFDYLHHGKDGVESGNETTRILQSRQKAADQLR